MVTTTGLGVGGTPVGNGTVGLGGVTPLILLHGLRMGKQLSPGEQTSLFPSGQGMVVRQRFDASFMFNPQYFSYTGVDVGAFVMPMISSQLWGAGVPVVET